MKTLNKLTLIASLLILSSLDVVAQSSGTLVLRFQPATEQSSAQMDLAQVVSSGDQNIVVPSRARGSGAGGWDPQFGAGKFEIQTIGNIVQIIVDSHTTAGCSENELIQRLGTVLKKSRAADYVLNSMSPEQIACVEKALISLREQK